MNEMITNEMVFHIIGLDGRQARIALLQILEGKGIKEAIFIAKSYTNKPYTKILRKEEENVHIPMQT